MTDMINKFYEKKTQLMDKLNNSDLNKETKELIKTAMEFSYSAAFCSRTSDMNESFYAASDYDSAYRNMLNKFSDE